MPNRDIKLYVSKPDFELIEIMNSLIKHKTETNVITTMSTIHNDNKNYSVEQGCVITFIDSSSAMVSKWWEYAKTHLGFNCCHIEDPSLNYNGCITDWRG